MSVFDRQGPPLAPSAEGVGDGQESSDPDGSGGPAATSADGGETASTNALQPYDPHHDARALVRLIQCQRCSLPLRNPMTLPCGNSICRKCLPDLHKREHITYPATRGWLEGFVCPFTECGLEHPLGNSSNDITLSSILERVSVEVTKRRPLTSDTPTLLDERPPWRNVVDSCTNPRQPHSRVLNGGRLVATFTMAELGELGYDADLSYHTCSPSGDTYQHLDHIMLEKLREVTRSELDCQVCFALMLDPLTLDCGHTFCRKCVARVLDHSQNCPACRRPLFLTPSSLQSATSNQRLSGLLRALCPEQVAARAQQVAEEEAELAEKQQVPLFICTLAYPRIPTFLHIFEPRYRLMIRRAMETDRKFGMLAYNSRGEPQGELGATQFMQYGTLLEIVNMHLFPNGRSVIETVGVSRFCVREFGMRDGYTVGRVDRIDDIPVAEEEALEAYQVAGVAPAGTPSILHTDPAFMSSPAPARVTSETSPALETMSTAQLMDMCTSFIRRMHSASAPWLSSQYIEAYGPMPDDPAVLPYWFASVLPINEAEKYRLLPTRSVRMRLMMCAEWIRGVERTRWYTRLHELLESGTLSVLASFHNEGDSDDSEEDDEDYEEEAEQGEDDTEPPHLEASTHLLAPEAPSTPSSQQVPGPAVPSSAQPLDNETERLPSSQLDTDTRTDEAQQTNPSSNTTT